MAILKIEIIRKRRPFLVEKELLLDKMSGWIIGEEIFVQNSSTK